MKLWLLKKYGLLFIGLFTTWAARAQYGNTSVEDLKQLKASITVVVIHNDSTAYNRNIVTAMNRFWTYNKFIFVKAIDAKKFLNDPQYSFLMTIVFDPNGKSSSKNPPHERLALGINKKKNISHFSSLHQVAWIELNSVHDHQGYDFCIINLVQSIQNYLLYGEKAPKQHVSDNDIRKLYNSKTKEIKYKSLYIEADYLKGDLTSIKAINAVYKYDVRVASKETILDVINKQDENAIYLFILDFKAIYVIAAKGGEIIYLNDNRSKVKRGVNKKNLEDLIKTLK